MILLLSLYWLKVLTKPGLGRMLTFVPPLKKPAAKGKAAGFTFGTDMGRADKKDGKAD